MRLRENRTLSVLLGAAVLVGAANVAAYSATGGNFLLGKSNKAGRTTVLTNTGSGAPLQLKGKDSAPPLVVSSKKRVARLNSDRLDGKDSAAFQPSIGPLVWKPIPVYTDNSWHPGSVCQTGEDPAYAVRLGVVYLRGVICDGLVGSQALTLPTEAIPQRSGDSVQFPAALAAGATGAIQIDLGSGAVFIIDATNSASSGFTSLEGVSYTR